MPQPTEFAGRPIALREAVALALCSNPELAAAAWEEPISKARTLQAGLRPNPELGVEVEQLSLRGDGTDASRGLNLGLSPTGAPSIAGSRGLEGEDRGFWRQAEITVRLSQVVELGGKRAARLAAARSAEDVAAWDYEVARFRVAANVASRFVSVLAAQERLRLASEAGELGHELAQAVRAQVDAGRVSPIEARRARAKRDSLRIIMRRMEAELEQARLGLAETWGRASAEFGPAVGDIGAVPPLAPLEALLARRNELPGLKRWGRELARRNALAELEDSYAVPNLTVSVGYRAHRQTGQSERSFGIGPEGLTLSRSSTSPKDRWAHSLLLEGSIPLPLFDRNQGRRHEAMLQISKGAGERRAAELRIVATLTRLHKAASAARRLIQDIEGALAPESERTYALTLDGYERGKFDYLAVLDAEEALNDARLQALDARLAYHEAVTSIEAVFGASIGQASKDNELPDELNHQAHRLEDDS